MQLLSLEQVESGLYLYACALQKENSLYQFHEESVYEQILHQCGLVANGAHPLGLLLVHLQVELRVEALEVVAGGGPARSVHPHLAQRAGERDLAGGGGDLLVLVRQLLLDQRLGVVRLPEPLGLQLVEEVHEGEALHQVDGHGVGSPDLHRPRHVDGVGGGGRQLAQRSDIYRTRGALK